MVTPITNTFISICCVCTASGSHLDDEWSELHRVRAYLVKEIDAADVMSYLRKPAGNAGAAGEHFGSK